MRIDVDACRDPDLLAGELRRLQAVIASEQTLTNEEREAIEWARCMAKMHSLENAAATLRGLLNRLESSYEND